MKKYCSRDHDRFTNSLKHAFVFISGSQIGLGMTPNGPTIWGGCITRSCPDRSVGGRHRVESQYFSREAVTSLTLTDRRERHGVQGGYGVFFAIRVQSFVAFTSVAVQSCQGVSQQSRCS